MDAMPSFPINNLTAPDNYSATSTLYPLPTLSWVNIDVVNAAIYWSIAQGNPLTTDRSGTWQPEVFMLPGSRQIVRSAMVGIKFRAAVALANLPAGGQQAQVTIEAVES